MKKWKCTKGLRRYNSNLIIVHISTWTSYNWQPTALTSKQNCNVFIHLLDKEKMIRVVSLVMLENYMICLFIQKHQGMAATQENVMTRFANVASLSDDSGDNERYSKVELLELLVWVGLNNYIACFGSICSIPAKLAGWLSLLLKIGGGKVVVRPLMLSLLLQEQHSLCQAQPAHKQMVLMAQTIGWRKREPLRLRRAGQNELTIQV